MHAELSATIHGHLQVFKMLCTGYYRCPRDFIKFSKALKSQDNNQGPLQSPPARLCHDILVDKNEHFFGRKDILASIDRYLNPSTANSGIPSVTLYGLRGVGKTQISLHYAHSKKEEVGIVIWIPAEDDLTIQHRLSHIALQTLHLDGAEPQSHKENAMRVIHWLQRSCKDALFYYY